MKPTTIYQQAARRKNPPGGLLFKCLKLFYSTPIM